MENFKNIKNVEKTLKNFNEFIKTLHFLKVEASNRLKTLEENQKTLQISAKT